MGCQVWSSRYEMETRMWASRRAQTLARTVEGMMYYEKALEVSFLKQNRTPLDMFQIGRQLKDCHHECLDMSHVRESGQH